MNTIGSSFNKLEFFCLIGMSGVGKSYWTEKLKTKGYQVFSSDKFIFEALQKKLPKNQDFMQALSIWMGDPASADYQEKADEYLHYENLSLEAAIDFYSSHNKAVIDSSGSIVFCKQDLIEKLKSKGPLVYLESNKSFYERITQNFVDNPKPIVWADNYNPELSLKDNFVNLIEIRARKYQSYADIIINSDQFKHAKTTDDFLQLISNEQTK